MNDKSLKIPSSANDVTGSWLTAALHDCGSLGSHIYITKLVRTDVEENFSSTIQRLEVTYSSNTNIPNAFILKFVTAHNGDSSPEKDLYFYQNYDRFGLPPRHSAKAHLALKFGKHYVFLLEDSPDSYYSYSPANSPPHSPILKTSSILMSLKNDTTLNLSSSSSSIHSFFSPSPSPSVSRSPSPTGTPYSTPPSSPLMSSFYGSSISPPSSPINAPTACFVPNCLVCSKGAPSSVLKSPTWSSIMRVVFYALQRGFPEKMFFNLRTDVYVFMANHWDKLCPSKDANHNWKKQIQDMLSHSKNMFESGTGVYKQNGFWRLKKPLMDPWSTSKSSFRGHRNKSGKCHFIQHHPSPPAKRVRTECHVPPLSENKTLVSVFRGLKSEMANLREQMQTILSQDNNINNSNNNISFYSSSSSTFLPSSSLISPSSSPSFRRSTSPMPMWEHTSKSDSYWNDPLWGSHSLFNNNVLPPIHTRPKFHSRPSSPFDVHHHHHSFSLSHHLHQPFPMQPAPLQL